MPISFSDLWEAMEQDKLQTSSPDGPDAPPSPDHALKDSGEETPGMRTIRTGLNIGEDFWDNFKSICNDADGLSDLLNIPHHKIASWAGKIDELVQKVQQADGDKEGNDKKSQLVPTGHEPTAGPEGNDSNANGPAETRPMP